MTTSKGDENILIVKKPHCERADTKLNELLNKKGMIGRATYCF